MTSKPTAPIGFTSTADADAPTRSSETIEPDHDFCLVSWCSFVNVGIKRSAAEDQPRRISRRNER